jgi:hypothetical protein
MVLVVEMIEITGKDLTGIRCGRLVTLQPSRIDNRGRQYWVCLCDCGKEAVVRADNLNPDGIRPTKSCGCLNVESRCPNSSIILFHQSEYGTWEAMKARCYNPFNKKYHRYGGRGIEVCEEWKHDFVQFLTDMGPRPPGLTLERVDSNKGYYPENCIWADYITQGNNTSRNVFVRFRGETLTLSQVGRLTGMDRGKVRRLYVKYSGDLEKALEFE